MEWIIFPVEFNFFVVDQYLSVFQFDFKCGKPKNEVKTLWHGSVLFTKTFYFTKLSGAIWLYYGDEETRADGYLR